MKFLKVAGIIIGVLSFLAVVFQCGYDYCVYEQSKLKEEGGQNYEH